MRSLARRLAILMLSLALAATLGPAVVEATQSVRISEFQFQPQQVTVAIGEDIEWRNDDIASHTVTFDDPALGRDSGVIGFGGTYKTNFAVAGSYTYHCAIHPFMTGTVIVSQTATPPPFTSPTPQPTPAPTPTPPPTAAPTTPAPTATPSPTPEPTGSPTASPEPSPTGTPTPSPTQTATAPPPTEGPTPTPTATPAAPGSTADANRQLGIGLVIAGVALLVGTLWWRLSRPAAAA